MSSPIRAFLACLALLSAVGGACSPPAPPAAAAPSAAATRLPPPLSATVGVAEPTPSNTAAAPEEDTRCEGPALALVVLVDRSGSMAGAPMTAVQAAVTRIAAKLAPNDLLEVIAFDASPARIVRMMQVNKALPKLAGALSAITVGGGTDFFSPLDDAYQDLTSISSCHKQVLLFTDGSGPSDGLHDLAVAMAGDGVSITVVGLGTSVDVPLLQSLADTTGGRFRAVVDPATLSDTVLNELGLFPKESR